VVPIFGLQLPRFAEVLEEEPLLVWPRDDWLACLARFLELPEEKKAALMDLYHPDLDSSSKYLAGLTVPRLAVGCGVKGVGARFRS